MESSWLNKYNTAFSKMCICQSAAKFSLLKSSWYNNIMFAHQCEMQNLMLPKCMANPCFPWRSSDQTIDYPNLIKLMRATEHPLRIRMPCTYPNMYYLHIPVPLSKIDDTIPVISITWSNTVTAFWQTCTAWISHYERDWYYILKMSVSHFFK